MSARVRFSPAPTGSLHVGSARTALFNWLFARHHGGTFVLRIEDTDRARSREEWVVGIQETLRWLGLDWDEGPFLQSERFEEYRAAADQLLGAGLRLRVLLHRRRARGAQRRGEGRGPAARLRRPLPRPDAATSGRRSRPRAGPARSGSARPTTGSASFVDVVRGEVRVEWSDDLGLRDRALRRQPDLLPRQRGRRPRDGDHPRDPGRGPHRLDPPGARPARGARRRPDRPVYAHLPLILGPDRAKLSKRHGAVALEDFRDAGYLPEAVCNYLALLGWSPDDGREVMDLDEIVERFDLDRVTHAAAAFDHAEARLDERRVDPAAHAPRARGAGTPARARRGSATGSTIDAVPRRARASARSGPSPSARSSTRVDFLFVDDADFTIADELWEKLAATERVDEILDVVDRATSSPATGPPRRIDLRAPLDASSASR